MVKNTPYLVHGFCSETTLCSLVNLAKNTANNKNFLPGRRFVSRLILHLTSDSDSAPNSTPESIFTQKTIISKSRMLEKCTNRNMNLMIIIGKSWSWHCLHIGLHDSRCIRTVQVQCVRWAKSVPSVGDRLSLFTPPILSSIIFLIFHERPLSCAISGIFLAVRP